MTGLQTCSTPDRGYMGDTRRGASLGRASRRGDVDTAARFHLRRVRLDSGGYDSGGAYWGHGGRLYEAYSADGAEFMTLRVWPADISAAFEARGGVRIGEPGRTEFEARFPRWHETGAREAAKDAVLEEYPDARFYR